MTTTLQVNNDNNLLLANNSLVLLGGIDAVAQNVTNRLKLVKGEYALDKSRGLDYTNQIFARTKSINYLKQLFKKEMLDVVGVSSVDKIEITRDGDNFITVATLRYDSGEVSDVTI